MKVSITRGWGMIDVLSGNIMERRMAPFDVD